MINEKQQKNCGLNIFQFVWMRIYKSVTMMTRFTVEMGVTMNYTYSLFVNVLFRDTLMYIVYRYMSFPKVNYIPV